MSNTPKIHITAQDDTGAAIKSCRDAFAKFGSDMAGMTAIWGAKLAGINLAFQAVGKAVELLSRPVMEFANAGEEIGRVAKITGISAENLSALKYAAEQSETSFEAVTKGMRFFQKSLFGINEEGEDTTKWLKALGVTAKDPYDALLQVADGFERIKDPNARATASLKLFGRAGSELIPLLTDLRSALEDARKNAHLFTPAEVQAADNFKDSITRLNANFSKLAANIGGPVVSALNDLFAMFGRGPKDDNLYSEMERIDSKISALIDDQERWNALRQAWGFEAVGDPVKIAKVNSLLERRRELLAQLWDIGVKDARKGTGDNAPVLPGAAKKATVLPNAAWLMDEDLKLMTERAKAEEQLVAHIDELGKTEVEKAKAHAFEKYQAVLKFRDLSLAEMEAYASEVNKIDDETMKKQAEAQSKLWQEQLAARNEWLESMAGVGAQFSALSLVEQTEMIPFVEEMILKYSELGLVGEEGFKKLTEALIKYNEEMRQLAPAQPTFNEGMKAGWQAYLQEISDNFKIGVQFAEDAARAMQDAFSDFFFDAMSGKLKTLADYWRSFSQTIMRYISEILSKQAMIGLFGDGKNNSGLGGVFGSIFSAITGRAAGAEYAGPGFHSGGMIVPKFHFGGLRGDERLAINKVGERYITAEQNQWLTNLSNAMKGMSGGGSQEPQQVTIIVQAVDPRSFTDLVERNPEGIYKVITSNLRRNGALRTAIKGAF